LLNASSNFETLNNLTEKEPIFTIQFDGVATVFSSGPYADAGASTKQLLIDLQRIDTDTDQQAFKTHLGGFTFSILDKDGEIRSLLANPLADKMVTAKTGYQGLNHADFVSLPVAYVQSYGIEPDLLTYTFKCRYKLSHYRTIFGNMGKTVLTKAIEAEDEMITGGDVETAVPVMNGVELTDVGCATLKDAGQAHGGSSSAKMTGTNFGGQTEFSTYFENSYFCGLDSGADYDVSIWVYNPAGQDLDRVRLYYTNSSSVDVLLDTTLVTGSWVKLTGSITGYMEKCLYIVADDQDAGGNIFTEFIYVDDWSIIRKDTEVYGDDISGFSAAGAAPWDADTYIKIDNEVIKYTAKTTYFTCVRGQLGTEIAHHDIGAEIREVIVVEQSDHGMEFLLNLLTTTAAGTNGDYDLGLENWGLGIDIDFIDILNFKNEMGDKGKWGDDGAGNNDFKMAYTPKAEVEKGLEWIEKNILSLIPAFFVLTETGKLGIKFWDISANKIGGETLTEDDILESPVAEILTSNIISHVELKGAYNAASGTWLDYVVYTCDECVAIWGEKKWLKLKSLWHDSPLFGDSFRLDRMIERIFGRFGNSTLRVHVSSYLKRQLLQVGDMLNVSHAKLPVFRDGSIGWTKESGEITSINMAYLAGRIATEMSIDNYYGVNEADIQDIHVFEQADLDRATLTEDANHAQGTLQAADAYIDQATYKATNVMVEIEITQPGEAGGDTEEYITLYIKVQNPVNTDIKEIEKRFYYNETSDEKVTRQFYALGMTSTTFARIRVDWTAHSDTFPPTDVTVKKVVLWDFKGTISS